MLTDAAARVRTGEDLAELLQGLRRRHARSRRDSSLTYRELAARTGWSQTAIAEYFTARTLPPTDRLDALLEVLGATPAERRALADARDLLEETNRRAKRHRTAGRLPPVRDAAVPRQLPAAPRAFVGRARELARLDAALDEQPEAGGALVISAIGGTGGIGKTWLALHWAHQRLDRFPDGQLYVNLRGFDPTGQPLAPAAALRGLLDALGADPSAIPVEPEAQAGLYRSLLAGKRMLILLDNARDTNQVAPLLPGSPACTVLVTSRRRLTGLVAAHGAYPMDLDVLPQDEARQLLARHLGHHRLTAEPDAAATLLAYCAGLPLALSIAAARITAHPHSSLTALAAELRDSDRLDALDAGEPQTNLHAVLSWTSQAVSADAAKAFALLGIAPGPDIALPAAANLLALPTAATRALLSELENAHLIKRHAHNRYLMHDLLRLHAAEQGRTSHTPADQQVALRRLTNFYAHTACLGGRLLAPQHPMPTLDEPDAGSVTQPLPDLASTITWFDAEHACLLATQRLAHSYGWDSQVYALAWALDPYHRRRGHLDDQATIWQLAVTSAQRLPDPAIRAHAHQMLGDAYAGVGRTTDALDHLNQALALAEHARDAASQANIHHSLGGSWERHGDHRRALEHAQQALRIFQSLDNTVGQARALNGVGWLQAWLGDYTAARANCEAALALCRQDAADGRQFGEAATLDSLGYIAHRSGDCDQALDFYHQALAICRTQGHSFFEAYVLQHIAETHLARHHFDQALDTWKQAFALYHTQHRLADAQHAANNVAAIEAIPHLTRTPTTSHPGTPNGSGPRP